MHLHGTRGADKTVMSQWQLWKEVTGDEYEFEHINIVQNENNSNDFFDKNDGISSGKFDKLEVFDGKGDYVLADDWSVHVVNLDDDEDFEENLKLF